MLIKAKYNIDIAIKYSIPNIQNTIIRNKMQKMLDKIYNGEGISKSFESINLFDDFVIRLMHNSEKGSDLEKAFEKLFHIYETKQDDKITQTIKMIEPIMVLIFSIIILFLALAIFLPLWDINQVML